MPVEITLPEVPGDPAGMRQLAGDLRVSATRIEGIGTGIGSAVGSWSFQGPAADRLTDAAQSSQRTLTDCATRLGDLARLLDQKATEVEEKQRARLDRLAQMRADLAEQGIPARVA
jgi:uncharacterized protein YukE